MTKRLTIIGAPSSAGALAPGQEKAPRVLRAAGLIDRLRGHGIETTDAGDVPGFRWRVDRTRPRSMNADKVEMVVREVATRVSEAFKTGSDVLVLGGDCTVELGTVAGALEGSENVGLVYIDLDTDLNTPESIDEGTLDWMGVAHMLGIEGTVPELARIGQGVPLIRSDQVLFFANDSSKPFERKIIEDRHIGEVPLATVVADPEGAARSVVNGWAKQFDRLLVHVDVDVVDFLDFPLSEERRRNRGLRWEQLTKALRIFLGAQNWTALTITELNPDLGDEDGSTTSSFVEALVEALPQPP